MKEGVRRQVQVWNCDGGDSFAATTGISSFPSYTPDTYLGISRAINIIDLRQDQQEHFSSLPILFMHVMHAILTPGDPRTNLDISFAKCGRDIPRTATATTASMLRCSDGHLYT